MRIAFALCALALVALMPAALAGPISNRIYPAPTEPLALPATPGAEFATVRTADGLTLKGIMVTGQAGKPVLLLFHGNGSAASRTIDWFAPIAAAQGFGLIAAEYRGYSGNPGTPDEPGLAADADAFYALAKAQAHGAPVWVVGHSLGGGVAFGLAARQHLDVLVTIGTFTRLRAMAPKVARAMVPDAYRNIEIVPVLDEPWFQIHGMRDGTVPATEAQALFAAAAAAHRDGAAFVISDADHQPPASELGPIFVAIAAHLGGAADAGKDLPAEIKVAPFVQPKP